MKTVTLSRNEKIVKVINVIVTTALVLFAAWYFKESIHIVITNLYR